MKNKLSIRALFIALVPLRHLLPIFSLLSILTLSSCAKKEKKDETSKTKDSLQTNAPLKQIVGIALIEPKSHIISLYSETGGIVAKINHDINDNLKAGDVILELQSDVEQAQLQQAQSKLATQQANINSTKSQLASIRLKAENAKVNFERNANLISSGGVTKQALDDSKFNAEALAADVHSSEAALAQQENKLAELQADINYAEKVIERKKIKAPMDGKLLSMDIKVGNSIGNNQSACDFAPAGQLMAVTEIDELYEDKIADGLNAYIRLQGKTDTLATGKIFLSSPYLRKKSLFSDAPSDMEDRRVREVRVLLDDASKTLIGSRVECVIQLSK